MTKIEEIEQRLEVMEKVAKAYGIFKEEVEQLQKALAELKESKKEKWKPAYDEVYFYRGDNGITTKRYCCDNQFDEWRFKNLPIFKTEEECERYWHFMDTVKEKSYEFSKEEWEESGIRKYSFYYKYDDNCFVVDEFGMLKDFGKIYFKDKESAQYIIDNFKDELMEYWI